VWREYYGKYLNTYQHAEILGEREQPSDYKVTGYWGDPRGADEASTIAMILGYVGSFDVPWKKSVEQIKRMLKDRPTKIYIDPSCTNLIREFPQLHVKPLSRNSQQDTQEQTGDGNIQHKVDDHCMDALRYFIGPHFVAGAGDHLADIYGEEYRYSESADYLTTLMDSAVPVLEQELTLGREF